MTIQETLAILRSQNVQFELIEHAAVMNMQEVEKLHLPHPEADAKNLFVRDTKGHYCLISVPGTCRVDLKSFRMKEGLGSLSFVREEEMWNLLSMAPGAVTPLGLLSDTTESIVLYLDEAFRGGLIGVHPNDNRATVFLKSSDLVRVIEANGNPVRWRTFSMQEKECIQDESTGETTV